MKIAAGKNKVINFEKELKERPAPSASPTPTLNEKEKGKGKWKNDTRLKVYKNKRVEQEIIYVPGLLKLNALGKIISEKPAKERLIKYKPLEERLLRTLPISMDEVIEMTKPPKKKPTRKVLTNSERCAFILKTGKRCSFKASNGRFCKKHLETIKDIRKEIKEMKKLTKMSK